MRRFPTLSVTVAFFLILFLNNFTLAQGQKPTGERIVLCMIQLEHADAEELAALLEPLLSPEGRMAPYPPTNTLIIRDRASVVDKLSIAIKGRPCTPIADLPEDEADDLKEQPRID